MRHPHTFLILILLFCASIVEAQSLSSATSESSEKVFRIGYLRASSEGGQSTSGMNRLRHFLEQEPGVMDALAAEGYDRIGLYEADGAPDLLPRMQSGNFQMVFATSTIWNENRNDYPVFLQLQQENDILNSRTGLSMRRGAIFMSARHPAWNENWQDVDWQDYLGENQIAVVQSRSLSGFVTPMLHLRDQVGISEENLTPLWCRSGDEVAKSVISGLVDIGACSERDLERTLRENGISDKQDELIRIIYRTTPVPATPVLVSKEVQEESPGLVRAIQRSLENSSGLLGDGVSFQAASSRNYREVTGLLERFETFRVLEPVNGDGDQ